MSGIGFDAGPLVGAGVSHQAGEGDSAMAQLYGVVDLADVWRLTDDELSAKVFASGRGGDAVVVCIDEQAQAHVLRRLCGSLADRPLSEKDDRKAGARNKRPGAAKPRRGKPR